jgi:ATP-dependent 26S proteasome regulatory subunit
MGQVDPALSKQQNFANEKVELQRQLDSDDMHQQQQETADPYNYWRNEIDGTASTKVSELVAKAGAESAFEGQTLGIGGLDDVLAQVKRRVWTPLAAPPKLLAELGITPVRGLLLYGKPGCGKTLLARKLGQMLSPLRYAKNRRIGDRVRFVV